MTHELKIQKQWADAKLAGEKPFEIRRNDRGFQKGDIVHYTVIDPKTEEPWRQPASGVPFHPDGCHPLEICDFVITYVREGADGLEKGYCVYADQPMPKAGPKPKGHEETFLEGFMCCTKDRLDALEKAMSARPVSADLRAGATPSNGDGEPLPPPAPLADSSSNKVHTGDSVAKTGSECKDFTPNLGGVCLYSRINRAFPVVYRCTFSGNCNCGKTCPTGGLPK